MSDLYKGKVTKGAIERSFRIHAESPDCDGLREAFRIHGVGCISSGQDFRQALPKNEIDKPHSVLYQLHANERLDLSVGNIQEGPGLTDYTVCVPKSAASLLY